MNNKVITWLLTLTLILSATDISLLIIVSIFTYGVIYKNKGILNE